MKKHLDHEKGETDRARFERVSRCREAVIRIMLEGVDPSDNLAEELLDHAKRNAR